ncbi:Vasotab, partial [Blattella germanica]
LSVVLAFIGLATAEKECSPICTLEYVPVCGGGEGGETKTFSNKCEFNYYNCVNSEKPLKLLKSGKC